jgi:TrmH family RNA methyltransferase
MKGTGKVWISPEESPGKIVTNPRSASVAALQRLIVSRDERERTGLFYTEGMRFVSRAAAQGARLESLVVAPDLLTHPFARHLWRDLSERGVPTLRVSAPIFAQLSLVEEPQGIGAVVRQRWERLGRIGPDEGLCWVALDTVRSTGNLGTILRTAEAVGARGLILIGSGIDPYAPAVVRATMGALFAQRFVRTDLPTLAAWRRRHGVTLVGASPHASDDYHAVRYPFPVVLWLGGERQGLSTDQQSVCDRLVRIPMVGNGDSLNLAIAAGVMLYELYNQRRDAGGIP